MGLGGGGGGSSAATAQGDTKEGRALYREQAGLAREQAGLIRSSLPLLEEQSGLIREQAATGRELRERSREQWDLYKTRALPVLDDLTRAVNRYGSEGRIREAEGAAATDVASSYDQQRRSLFSNLGRFGVRPGSGRFTSALRSLALGQASDTAGAKTRTRRGILDRDIANRFGLAGAWQGRDSSALAGLGGAGSLIGQAGNALGSGYARAAGALGQAGQGLGQAAGGFMSSAASQRQASATAQGGLWSGLGSLAGSLGGAWILSSDERLKENIKPVGMADKDIFIYEFNYLDDPDTTYTGVMAQQLMDTRPWHIHEIEGFLFVDYGRLLDELANEHLKEAA